MMKTYLSDAIGALGSIGSVSTGGVRQSENAKYVRSRSTIKI